MYMYEHFGLKSGYMYKAKKRKTGKLILASKLELINVIKCVTTSRAIFPGYGMTHCFLSVHHKISISQG